MSAARLLAASVVFNVLLLIALVVRGGGHVTHGTPNLLELGAAERSEALRGARRLGALSLADWETGDSILYTSLVKSGSDKVVHHGYHRYYTEWLKKHLSNRETEGLRMLEIGVEKGASMLAWEHMFPRASLFGIGYGNGQSLANDGPCNG